MSLPVKYDFEKFTFERAESLSSKVGEFLIGLSKLGAATATAWVPIEVSSFSMTASYGVEDGILIVDADTATVSMSYWTSADTLEYPLYAGDRVRASYDTEEIFLGTVDRVSVRYVAEPSARRRGAARLVSFQAEMLGTYAVMMGRIICHGALPAETAIQRIRRWATVTGW